MTTTAAAAGTRRHTGTYPAEPRQVGIARAVLAEWLAGCPQADEAVLVASEFATNSVLHSAGGPWRGGACDDGRPHGFDVVAAIAGAGNWGIEGDARGRTAWVRLGG